MRNPDWSPALKPNRREGLRSTPDFLAAVSHRDELDALN